MAELGNLFAGSSEASGEKKVEVEMLDYGYINDCKDWSLMSAIVEVLKSGREGHYPDLIRVAEEKLVELLPAKEKRRYMSLSHKTTPAEIAEAEAELNSWQRTVLSKDQTLASSKSSTVVGKKAVPVRGSSSSSSEVSPAQSTEVSQVDSLARVQDERILELLALLNTNQRKKFDKLQAELGVEHLTRIKRQHRAGLEKIKGNESFRIAENQDAVACYSKSLALDPTSAVVWANRAMAYIRMELFDLAEADSSVALLLDPSYVKAYSRRGLVRFKRGKYAEAVEDFREALALDPDNAELTKLMHTAREKYLEVAGTSFGEEGVVRVESSGDVEVQEMARPVSSDGVSSKEEEEEEEVLLVQLVADSAELLLPPVDAVLLKAGNLSAGSNFVRINVVSDDETESDEEEEEEAGGGEGPPVAYNRIAIVDESDSEGADDGNEDGSNSDSDSAEQREQRATELKERGNLLLKQGDAVGAVEAYTAALSFLPSHTPSLNNRAQAHLALKAYQQSEQDSTAVLAQEPGNVKALFRRAIALRALKRSDDALLDLSTVLKLDPDNAAAQELQAELTAQLDSASPSSNCHTRSPPLSVSATIDVQKLRQRAQQLLGDGLNDKVVALLAQYFRATDQPPFCELLQSDQTSLLHLLATAYSSTEDYAHAVAVQATILGIDPTNSRALYKRAEGQLQIASQATGEARRAALVLAEGDVEAALAAQSGGTEVMALRQKLLRLRNTLPDNLFAPPSTPARAAAPSQTLTPSSSRQQSDVQKDLGNKAMTDKNFSTAVMHYTNAIKFDETNFAAFNNRALAHLKLGEFASAAADATVVIGDGVDSQQSLSGGSDDGISALRLKALCRRAQARRSIGEALVAQGSVAPVSSSVLTEGQARLASALSDLQTLLKLDPNNKTALAEQKSSNEVLKRCTSLLAPLTSVTSKPASATAAAAATPEAKPKPPRADISRVSAMFSSPSASSSPVPSAEASAFGGLGMVARTSKKLNTAAASPSSSAAAASVAVEVITPAKAPAMAVSPVKKAAASPTPSIVLTAAPTEPPKTVYEFERVWRGLKGRPDLFAQYIACFKKSTFKKVLKEAVSPDLVSFMWKALRDHAPSPQVQMKALAGFSGAPSFALTLSLLPGEDLRCVHSILASLQGHADTLPAGTDEERAVQASARESVATLFALYGSK